MKIVIKIRKITKNNEIIYILFLLVTLIYNYYYICI